MRCTAPGAAVAMHAAGRPLNLPYAHAASAAVSSWRTWATFAASIGRDPKWIAAQIGHTDPQFTFSVYQQVATRRYIDEQAIWAVMRFADEPAERARSRQLTRIDEHDPRGPGGVGERSPDGPGWQSATPPQRPAAASSMGP